MIPFVIPKNFNLERPPLHIFLPISPRFLTNIRCRYFSLNIWVVYDQSELDWCIFDQNWAKTRPLHFQIFQILNATDRLIVHWDCLLTVQIRVFNRGNRRKSFMQCIPFFGRQSRIKCLNHGHGKIWPLRIQSWLGMLGLSSILRVTFLGHPFLRRQCCLLKMSRTMNKMQVGSSIPKRMDNG